MVETAKPSWVGSMRSTSAGVVMRSSLASVSVLPLAKRTCSASRAMPPSVRRSHVPLGRVVSSSADWPRVMKPVPFSGGVISFNCSVAFESPPTWLSVRMSRMITPAPITTPCMTSVHTTARNPPNAVYTITEKEKTSRQST